MTHFITWILLGVQVIVGAFIATITALAAIFLLIFAVVQLFMLGDRILKRLKNR